jgi:opacity protein-like surface antigen
MKKILLISALLFITLFYSQSNAQSKFIIHVTGGYSQPMGDFKSDIIPLDTASANWPYRLKSGFNIGATGKLALGKTGNFRLTFGLNFNSFSNEGTVDNVYAVTTPPPGFITNNIAGKDGINGGPSTRTFDPKVSLITIALGGEYAFIPNGNINPFVGLELTTSFWGGSFKFTPSDTGIYRDQTMKSEARFGLQFGGGCEFKLSRNIGLVAGLKYNIANLVGKGQEIGRAHV